MLQRRDAGRATFLPLDTIRGSRMHDAPEDDPGFVGIASDLVQADAKYSQIVLNLLGRTVVAERLTDAIRMSKKSGNRLRIVTLDGQMIHAGGSMTGGSRVAALQRTVETLRYELQMAQEDLTALDRDEAALEAEKHSVESSTGQFRALLDAISGDSENRRKTVAAAEQQTESFRERLREKQLQRDEVQREVDAEKAAIRRISDEKLELEGKRTRADKQAQQLNADINDLERRVSRAEQALG